MMVLEILEDVAHRVGNEVFRKYGEPYTLRAMNRIYRQVNRRYLVLEKETVLTDWSSADNSCVLPADFIRMIRIEPEYDFVDPHLFDGRTEKTFTIRGGRIAVSELPEDGQATIRYYSAGKTLAAEVADADTETDAPEWPEAFHDLLFYKTCLELSLDYPQAKADALEAQRLLSELSDYRFSLQEVTPRVTGGIRLKQTRDPYE